MTDTRETTDQAPAAEEQPPTEAWTARRSSWRTRAVALLIMLGAVGLLLMAARLKPNPLGYGTHTQIPYQGPCAMLVTTGYPCPTCGMTTAFAHTVRGQWLRAARVQPGGFVLALATIGVVFGAGWVVIVGRCPMLYWPWLTPFRLFAALLVLLLGSWAFVLVAGLLDGSLPVK